jgi:4-aminobutyrate aminotransferase
MEKLFSQIPFLTKALPHLVDSIIVRGEGPCLWDHNGRQYLDFTSGIGVTSTGHCHPKVVAAIIMRQCSG